MEDDWVVEVKNNASLKASIDNKENAQKVGQQFIIDIQEKVNQETYHRRIVSVALELMNNILKHAHEEKGSFYLYEDQQHYYLMSENKLRTDEYRLELEKSITQINEICHDVKAIRKMFKSITLENRNKSWPNRMGVGFLDMMPKTRNPIKYKIVGRNKQYATAYIMCTITKKQHVQQRTSEELKLSEK